MPLPSSLTGPEVDRLLEMTGLNKHRQFGPYAIFVDQADNRRIVQVLEGWDISTDDLIRNLEKNGFNTSRHELEEAYERLYRPG